MKKFNKVRTVKMQVNAEVLPLNATFIARAMKVKHSLELLKYTDIENLVRSGDDELGDMLRDTREEAIAFFNDLYEAMAEEEDKPVESKTKRNFTSDDDLFGGDAPIGTHEQPRQTI